MKNSQEIKNKMITSTNRLDVRTAANVSLDVFKQLNEEEKIKYNSQFIFEEKHIQGHDFYFLLFKNTCIQLRAYKDGKEIQYESDKVAESAYEQLKQY
jgi:hypothetical protein